MKVQTRINSTLILTPNAQFDFMHTEQLNTYSLMPTFDLRHTTQLNTYHLMLELDLMHTIRLYTQVV